jgi:hypothetical protein
VKYDDETAKEKGKAKGSIFDALKDLDYKQCLDRCVAINKASAMTAKGDKVEDKVEEATPSPPQEMTEGMHPTPHNGLGLGNRTRVAPSP